MNRIGFCTSTLFGTALLTACSAMAAPFSQAELPPSIQVPAGHSVAWETVGMGDITYECKQAKSGTNGQVEWTFAGPNAVLNDRMGKQVGTYYGPPATWQATDGSKLTATQVAVAPAGAGNLPFQLVKANPVVGDGALKGVTYIQRVALKGGVAPQMPCKLGERTKVPYQADYIFWKAN